MAPPVSLPAFSLRHRRSLSGSPAQSVSTSPARCMPRPSFFYHSCVPCPVLHLIFLVAVDFDGASSTLSLVSYCLTLAIVVFCLPKSFLTLTLTQHSLARTDPFLPAIMADIETCSRSMQGVSLDQSRESRPSPTPQGNNIAHISVQFANRCALVSLDIFEWKRSRRCWTMRDHLWWKRPHVKTGLHASRRFVRFQEVNVFSHMQH